MRVLCTSNFFIFFLSVICPSNHSLSEKGKKVVAVLLPLVLETAVNCVVMFLKCFGDGGLTGSVQIGQIHPG